LDDEPGATLAESKLYWFPLEQDVNDECCKIKTQVVNPSGA
jgi:hypothetical protein